MARRSLLPGFIRIAGSAKRVRAPNGDIISDRAYNDIVNLNRLQTEGSDVFKSGRARAVEGNTRGLTTARKIMSESPISRGVVRDRDFGKYFLQQTRANARRKTSVYKNAGKKAGRNSFLVRNSSAERALANRAKRLRGEHIPNGEYQQMMDYMAHYRDPYYRLMRGSPNVKGQRITK